MTDRIVYAATHAWLSPVRVGSHHIARYLARRHRVFYSSHPISLSSLISPKDNQLRERLSLWHAGAAMVNSGVELREATWFMPFAPGPGFPINTRLACRFGHRLCWPNPLRTVAQWGFEEPDQLWVDSLFQSYWATMLNPRRVSVRVADHPMHIARLSKPLMRALHELLACAHNIITPNETTADYLQSEFGGSIKLVPNGVDVAHFEQEREIPAEYQGDTRQKVIFVGALADWIDIDLVRKVAELCNDLVFYLIGPNHNQPLKHLPDNLIYLGSRPYEEIPAYLQHANAAIAPFDVNAQPEFIETIDAIKLYEYTAARLPTVATRWGQSCRLFPYVVTVEQQPAAFADALRGVLEQPHQHQAPEEYIHTLDWSARLAALG